MSSYQVKLKALKWTKKGFKMEYYLSHNLTLQYGTRKLLESGCN
jgi:hypothetical protein